MSTGLLLIALGIFAASGGIFDWDWFMNNYKARFLSAFLTRNGARIFYVILGLSAFVFGVLFLLGIIKDQVR
jgi:hypothetical protein